eukprot:1066491-Rhodomonas_salina.3
MRLPTSEPHAAQPAPRSQQHQRGGPAKARRRADGRQRTEASWRMRKRVVECYTEGMMLSDELRTLCTRALRELRMAGTGSVCVAHVRTRRMVLCGSYVMSGIDIAYGQAAAAQPGRESAGRRGGQGACARPNQTH